MVESLSAVAAGLIVDALGTPTAAAWFGLGFGLCYLALLSYSARFKNGDENESGSDPEQKETKESDC